MSPRGRCGGQCGVLKRWRRKDGWMWCKYSRVICEIPKSVNFKKEVNKANRSTPEPGNDVEVCWKVPCVCALVSSSSEKTEVPPLSSFLGTEIGVWRVVNVLYLGTGGGLSLSLHNWAPEGAQRGWRLSSLPGAQGAALPQWDTRGRQRSWVKN